MDSLMESAVATGRKRSTSMVTGTDMDPFSGYPLFCSDPLR